MTIHTQGKPCFELGFECLSQWSACLNVDPITRAHTIVELRVRRQERDGTEVTSKMSLVDLAGRGLPSSSSRLDVNAFYGIHWVVKWS
jgi:hypothetical protein